MEGAGCGAFEPSLALPIKRRMKERETVLAAAADGNEGTGITTCLAAGAGGFVGLAAGAGVGDGPDWRWIKLSKRWRKAANASPSWRALLCCHMFGSVM
jgi:hypothetical protein